MNYVKNFEEFLECNKNKISSFNKNKLNENMRPDIANIFQKSQVNFSDEKQEIVEKLRLITKKHPNYFNFLLNIFVNSTNHPEFKNVNSSLSRIEKCFNILMTKKEFFQALEKPILSIENIKELEEANDYLDLYQKTNKLVQKLNKPLRDEIKADKAKLNTIMAKISDMNVYNFMNTPRGTSYTNYEDLLSALDAYSTPPDIKTQIESTPGAELLYEKDGVFVAKINTFEASKELGSKNWSITYGKIQFDQYVRPGFKQFFIWNTNIKQILGEYLIGVTLSQQGKTMVCFDHFGKMKSFPEIYHEFEIPREIFK